MEQIREITLIKACVQELNDIAEHKQNLRIKMICVDIERYLEKIESMFIHAEQSIFKPGIELPLGMPVYSDETTKILTENQFVATKEYLDNYNNFNNSIPE